MNGKEKETRNKTGSSNTHAVWKVYPIRPEHHTDEIGTFSPRGGDDYVAFAPDPV